jgi:hypothetical protein
LCPAPTSLKLACPQAPAGAAFHAIAMQYADPTVPLDASRLVGTPSFDEDKRWHDIHWERPSPASAADDMEYFLRRPLAPAPRWSAAAFTN